MKSSSSLPNLSAIDSGIDPSLRDEFRTYLHPSKPTTNPTAHRLIFRQFIDQANKLLGRLRHDLNTAVLKRADGMAACEAVLNRLRSFYRMDVRSLRKKAAVLVILYRKEMKVEKLKTQSLQAAFEKVVLFIEFLNGLEQDDTLPVVDMDAFRKSLDRLRPDTRKLQNAVRRLRAAAVELQEPKPNSGNWYYNLIHPKTRTGKIIARFEQRIDDLVYDDVYSIIEHLSATREDFERVEDLLFDLGWQKKQCPFGLLVNRPLPVKPHLFPAVLGVPNDIDERFRFMAFSELHGADWPLKKATDMLFEMLILPNPFDVMRCFWNVIQEVADALHDVRDIPGRPSAEVDIGFDAIFPLLMACVFAFGVDEWIQVAFYTVSFSEHATSDSQLQFAMTYLEGLITQMLAIDGEAIERTAAEMLATRGQPSD
jgi:hypothetical protein